LAFLGRVHQRVLVVVWVLMLAVFLVVMVVQLAFWVLALMLALPIGSALICW
jgi:hypothetical protein